MKDEHNNKKVNGFSIENFINHSSSTINRNIEENPDIKINITDENLNKIEDKEYTVVNKIINIFKKKKDEKDIYDIYEDKKSTSSKVNKNTKTKKQVKSNKKVDTTIYDIYKDKKEEVKEFKKQEKKEKEEIDDEFNIYKDFEEKEENKVIEFLKNVYEKIRSVINKDNILNLLYRIKKGELTYQTIVFVLVFLIIIVGSVVVYQKNFDEDYIMGEKFDFESNVTIKDGSNKYTLEQFLVCSATKYISFNEATDDYPSKYELLSAYYLYSKATLFKNGYYSVKNKKIDFDDIKKSFPDFDPSSNCVKDSGESVDEFLSRKYPSIYVAAYFVVYNNLLVPNSFNVNGDELFSDSAIYKSSTEIDTANKYINTWSSKAVNSNYQTLLKGTHPKYYIYSLYDNKYNGDDQGESISSGVWPIGSSDQSGTGLYLNKPVSSTLTNDYGKDGIEITINVDSANIIAIYPGVVSKTGQLTRTGNDTKGIVINEELGNYIEITHSNGLVSVYGNLDNNLSVKIGDSVKKGQKIGAISRVKMLYLYMMDNEKYVSPLDYVSIDNPRPNITQNTSFVQGSNNKQSICLTLKASGFDNNAVAAILANLQAESNFKNTSCGDFVGGVATSYGIVQWHNGRFNNLIKFSGEKNTNFYSYKNAYCGNSNYAFSDLGVQLNYMMKELNSSYYRKILKVLNSNSSARYKGYYWCYHYEAPAKRDKTCDAVRGVAAQNTFLKYVRNNCK